MKQPSNSSVDVPPYYMQMARHWRMGSQSSDSIRRRLLQRGLTPEQTFKAIELLEQEDKHAENRQASDSYPGRLRLPISVGGFILGYRPGTLTPQARTWLIGYMGFVVLGVASFLFQDALGPRAAICMLLGNAFLVVGVVGLVVYAINLLVSRFL